MKKILLLILVVAFSFNVSAETKKEQFVKLLASAISMKFCTPNGVFLGCFDVTESKCHAVVKSASSHCQSRMNRTHPGEIKSSKQAGNYAAIYATCVASTAGNVIKDKIRNTTNCKSILSTNSGIKE